MCRWPLRAPTPLRSIPWRIIDPILVTFGQIFNFRDPNSISCFFSFSFWHSEEEFERTTFYTLTLAVSTGMACSPSRQEGVLPKVNFVFLFQTNFKWRELLMSCTLTFRPWCSFNSCIRSLCIYLQHSPPWQESYLAPLSHQASLRGLLRQS